jgi:hypothetical protein
MSAERLPSLLLRLTGLALAGGALALYIDSGWSILALVLLLLAPDLSLAGYALGPRRGAVIYNLGHALPASLALAAIGVLVDSAVALQVGLAWTAHIGVDWALGYGFKYPSEFEDTHLQRV